MKSVDSFRTTKVLHVGTKSFSFFSLRTLEQSTRIHLARLPISLKILLENLLRREDGKIVRKEDIQNLIRWDPKANPSKEIAFMPARVLLQDFTGVPCIIDLAVMRDAMIKMGEDPEKINPVQPVDLVIDHSVQVDEFGTAGAFQKNAALEFERNRERYAFLRWGQQAFKNFRVVPPDTGIVHQVNLEYLAQVVFSSTQDAEILAYPDTLIGTDSHTTMINGLGVLGWGVGGIEAEAVMLGQPISMLLPQVVGFKLSGKLQAGVTATDLVLTITQQLRRKGVVGKFVEFFGPGVSSLTLSDRATIANMAPEYGATIGFFPVDSETINFLHFTGRSEEHIALIEAYLVEQGLFHSTETPEPEFSNVFELDLSSIEPSIAGPKRPQDRISFSKSKSSFRSSLIEMLESKGVSIDKMKASTWAYYSDESLRPDFLKSVQVEIEGSQHTLQHGSVVIAAITSCTNTSNPSVLITAGLLAKNAYEKGLKSKPWVKTSLAPGSKVVMEYLRDANLVQPLESLGFHLVGYGCTTCIGNSGPLPEKIAAAIQENDLIAAAVLSGNRNFEGRVNPLTMANYLASPPLVVAYALAGTMDIDFVKEPIGVGPTGESIFLKNIWPSPQEIEQTIHQSVKSEMFKNGYANVFDGDENWKNLPTPTGAQYPWETSSTYIKAAPYFENLTQNLKPLENIHNARVLALLGDSVTTDHISPAGSFTEDTPAGTYLLSLNVPKEDFNQYGARRGNHEIMMRGTFANIRLKNLLIPGKEGGITLHPSSTEPISIYDAAMKYKDEGTPLIVIAGKEYGSGSSRDWAAKGPALLGVKAVIAESFERIHRSNLIGMGILPLQFEDGQNSQILGISGTEVFDIEGLSENLQPRKKISVIAISPNGSRKSFNVVCRIDTPNEVDYYRHQGILPYVLRSIIKPEQPIEEQPQKKPVASGKTPKYRILFNGEIVPDQDLPEVKKRLTQLFKTSPEQIEKLFTGKPVTINTNLDYAAAQEYLTEMKNAGALCYFEPMKITPPISDGTKDRESAMAKSGSAAPSSAIHPKSSLIAKTGSTPALKSQSYKNGWILSAVGMIFLLCLYVFAILFIASMTFDHMVDNTFLFEEGSFLFGFLIYIIPLLLGIVLIVAMLKPLIAPLVPKQVAVPLPRKKESVLYAFVEQICKAIGSKVPSTIEVNCSVNITAGFRRGLIGFLEDDLTLTIGLPAVSEMTTLELSCLLVHEFDHFTQKLGMRLYYIISSVHGWFFRRIFEEDKIDQKLAVVSKTSSDFLRITVFPVTDFIIWLSRKILTGFMLAGNIISKFYVRQMEFDADRQAVRFTSAEAFESSLLKLQELNVSLKEAYSQLKMQKKPTDNSLPDDFVLLVSSVKKQTSNETITKAKEDALKSLKGMPEKDPTDRERIEKAKIIPTKFQPPTNDLASTIFTNFNELSKIASLRLYREVLGLQIGKDSLVSTKEFIAPPGETPEATETQTETDSNFF